MKIVDKDFSVKTKIPNNKYTNIINNKIEKNMNKNIFKIKYYTEKTEETRNLKKFKRFLNYKSIIYVFFSLIIICIITRLSCTSISITPKGNGVLKIYCPGMVNIFDESTPNICDVNNNNELKCTFEDNNPATINFKTINFVLNFSQMFKDSYIVKKIDFSGFDYNEINDLNSMFENCINVEEIKFGNFRANNAFNMSKMFYNCSLLSKVDFNNFETSNVIDMSYMFSNCRSLSIIDLKSFNTSKVTNMKNMFEYCIILDKIEQNFLTLLVTNMEYMFSNCKTLKSLNIINFDFSSVTTMNSLFKENSKLESVYFPKEIHTPSLTNIGSMFKGCNSLKSIDLSNFDTYKVRFMNNLFHDCKSLISFNISSFDTSNVIKMESMFENCYSLSEINLINFYTPSVRQIYNMFYGCISMTSINISNFDTFQVTNFANLFYNCYSLKEISLTNLETNMISDMSNMFYNCSSIISLNLTNFNTERVIKMNSMFEDCSSLEEIKIDIFENNQTIDMSRMFYGCKELRNITLNNFYTNQTKYMHSMFEGCNKLSSLDLSAFSTDNVINMNSMFYKCSSILSFNLKNFNTSQVKDMSSMFAECSNIIELDISIFETDNVEKTNSMFKNCNELKYVSLPKFEKSNIISMQSMFYGCHSLEEIDLSKFRTNKVVYMDSLFHGCSSLIILDLQSFDFSYVKNMGYMFFGCKSLTSIILSNLDNSVATNTSHMFMGCSTIDDIDLNSFNVENVIDFDYMFADCVFLQNLYLDKWNPKNAKSMKFMFSGCSSLSSLNLFSLEKSKLGSIQGMFFGCISLTSLDLSKFNTSSVVNTAYMFYKDFSLKSINFYSREFSSELNETINIAYFNTDSVKNMEYMFAYCYVLEKLDLSFFNTFNVLDMSFMFKECNNLTSVNLSNFDTSSVTTLEGMFYNCSNLSYINLNNTDDTKIKDIDLFIYNIEIFTVFCIDDSKARKLSNEINKEDNCYTVNCSDDAYEYRKRYDIENNKCVDNCRKVNKYEYKYRSTCHTICPNETYVDEYMCIPFYNPKEECTIQRVFLGECPFNELKEEINNTNIVKTLFIDKIMEEIEDLNFNRVINKVKNGELIKLTLFNETYQFSALSNKNKLNNLIYIDIQDCENLLKVKNGIPYSDELIFFKIEYTTEYYKIPIVEYKIYHENTKRWINVTLCNCMKFFYYIPIPNDISEEYLHDPQSDYYNDFCYQYTTENETDILLYDRRKVFNEYNMSLCEKNCKYIGKTNERVICECEVKEDFNKFLLNEDSSKNDSIFKFEDNKLSKYNFEILKCFKMMFTKKGFYGNYSSILYMVMIAINILIAFLFCIRGYKSLYAQIKWVSKGVSEKNKTKKKLNIIKKKVDFKNKNLITSGNPPPKIKNILITGKNLQTKKIQYKLDKSGTKVNAPSSLIDSRNKFKKGLDNNLKLNKLDNDIDNDFDEFLDIDQDIEINFLLYEEALKKDNRSFFIYYISLLKSRHILVSIFIKDYNSLLIKICFLIYVFSLNLGINTIFFTDKSIQNIYKGKGKYTFSESISYHMIPIIISGAISSIIKSITAIFIYSDSIILKLKENKSNSLEKEEEMNKALITITSRSMMLFIINFIFLFIFWIYTGSICAVFKNSQIYLILNGILSFSICILSPLLYNIIPSLLRSIALQGKTNECLYKISQFFQMI